MTLSFRDLPREIRDMIYHLSLTNTLDPVHHRYAPIDENRWSSNPGSIDYCVRGVRNDSLHLRLGLLETCRQIYEEAAPYFWHDNKFIFSARNLVTLSNLLKLTAISPIKSLLTKVNKMTITSIEHYDIRETLHVVLERLGNARQTRSGRLELKIGPPHAGNEVEYIVQYLGNAVCKAVRVGREVRVAIAMPNFSTKTTLVYSIGSVEKVLQKAAKALGWQCDCLSESVEGSEGIGKYASWIIKPQEQYLIEPREQRLPKSREREIIKPQGQR